MRISDWSSDVCSSDLFPAVELQGQAAPGVSSGDALTAMENIAAKTLPDGFAYEWTALAYQQKAAGSSAVLIFLLAVVFVFLVLGAQYESVPIPLAVILIVPKGSEERGVGKRGVITGRS